MENIIARELAEPEPVVAVSPAPAGETTFLKASADGFFTTEAELKNIAAGVAFTGAAVEPALARIRRGYDARLDALTEQYRSVVSEIEQRIQDYREKILKEEERLREASTGIASFRQELGGLQFELRRLDVAVSTALTEMRKLRLDHARAYFEKQTHYLDAEILRSKEEILEDLRNRREIAEEIYKLQREHWETNRAEFERRAKLVEAELNRVEDELGQARERTARLQDLGISRTTANFLIWVGYISLAGVGGVVGSFLQKRQAGAPDFLSQLFNGFINLVNKTQPSAETFGSWWIVVAPLPLVGFVVTYLAVLYVVVWFMDGRLRGFDDNWGAEQKKKREKGRGGGREHPGKPKLLDRFSSYMPTPDVDRSAYRQMLAYFPFVVLFTLLVWLFAAGIPPATNPTPGAPAANAPPSLGLATAYLGVIFTLLTTSAALLYATKIIEPRWRKWAETSSDSGAFDKYVRLNWEVALLMALLIVTLLLAALMPTGAAAPGAPADPVAAERYSLICWGAIAIFMCLCSLGLAYGLIQRGLFRNEEYFERLRLKYRILLEQKRIEPTIYDIFDARDDDPAAAAAGYREARHLLDEYRMIYELKEIFDDDFDEEPALRKVFGKIWPDSTFTLRSVRIKSMPPGEPRPIDYEVAPEHTANLLRSRAERKTVHERLEFVDTELARLQLEKTEAANRIERLNQEVTVRRRQMLDVRQEYDHKRSSLSERQEKEVLKFEAAYAVGWLAYVQLRDEFVPRQAPPAPPDSDMDM